jgi:photosystem II stability/assembly factor-like uncharacterized protein
MKKIRIDITIVLVLVLMFFMTSNVLAMKLLTTKIGWFQTERGLYWTTNGGSTWKNITPPSESFGQISAVDFLNTTQGWALCAKGEDKYKEFYLAYTNDSGSTWLNLPIKLPDQYISFDENKRKMNPFSDVGWIDFIDAKTGWIVLEFPASARMTETLGIILRTDDGGKTFKLVIDYSKLPTAGDIYFVNTKDGWLVGDPNSYLYVTHDGGNTWKEVNLEQPSDISTSGPIYDLPIFKDNQNGFLPVIYVTGITATLALFATQDGAKTWKVDRSLPCPSDVIPSTMVNSVLITLTASEDEHSLTLIKAMPDGSVISTTANAMHIKGNINPHSFIFSAGWHLTFITSKQGWVSTYTNQLLSTDDGGKTWTVITPQ